MNFSQHWSDGRANAGRSRKTWVLWLVLLCLVVGAATWVQWQNIIGNADLFEEETAEITFTDLLSEDEEAPPPLAGITLPDILPEAIELEDEGGEEVDISEMPLAPDKTGMQWMTYQKAAEDKALLAIVIKASASSTPPACPDPATKALENALNLGVPLAFNITPAPCVLKEWLPLIQAPSEHQILLALGTETSPEHLAMLSELLPDAVGVTGHFNREKNNAALKPTFNQMRREGLFYLGNDKSLADVAQSTGTSYLAQDITLPDASALEGAEKILLTRNTPGQVTIIEVPMTPTAISALQKMVPRLQSKGIVIVPLSLLLTPALLKQHFDASGAI